MTFADWLKHLIIIRGGGDIASGTIYKLFRCGFPLLVLETGSPACIRRTVSFCEAVTYGETEVEGVTAKLAETVEDAYKFYRERKVPVMVDPRGLMIRECRPAVVVDAILAKRNLGTSITDASVVIGLGPGFVAGEDVHAVIETKRGHDLGRVIHEGPAAPNTGIPGMIAGYGAERVIHAPAEGIVHILKDIGELVTAGEEIACIRPEMPQNSIIKDDISVYAPIPGIIRGMIREGFRVTEGLKMADIDPRLSEKDNFRKISDKARCVAGGVLEAILEEKGETENRPLSPP